MTPAFLLCLAAGAAPAPEAAAAPETFVGPATGMKFVRIPAGKFRMGSPDTEPDRRSDEGPVHEVTITRPFLLGTCEVTVGQFRKFVEETGYKTDAERGGRGSRALVPGDLGRFRVYSARYWASPGFEQTDDHPVTCVSWNDAVEFCKWFSRKEGRNCRLPTEAEWEYAARAGAAGRWPTGDEPASLSGHANVRDKPFPAIQHDHKPFEFEDGFVFTTPVGRFKPNAWGLHDMVGNVCEWCADGMRDFTKEPVVDPKGPEGMLKAIRGASFYAGPETARLAARNVDSADGRSVLTGFRVVAEPK
jgi:formylglycine-generating enzyme required for sulfatase activity